MRIIALIIRYLWTLECPNAAAKSFNVPDPVMTAGPSPTETIDTTLARSNVTWCACLGPVDGMGCLPCVCLL